MPLSEQLVTSLLLYGLPVLFGTIFLAAVGLPLPASLLLITTGAFTAQGQFDLRWVVVLATSAAVLGDHVGYALGRWGGRHAVVRLSRWMGGPARLEQAEAVARRWGGLSVFLSRWLLPPLGPAINVTSGMARYPWPKFVSFAIAGELLWVVLYLVIGRSFSDQIDVISGWLGDITWWICAALAAVALTMSIVRYVLTIRAASGSVDTGRVPPDPRR